MSGGSSLSQSAVENPLDTSQRETISAGTVLGLNDVYYQNEPDLTYYCSECSRFVSLLTLREHKSYHRALTLLQFEKCPSSTADLLNRRNEAVRKLKKDAAEEGILIDIKYIKLIDEAYELLKQEIEDTYESCRKIEENINFKVDSFDLNCSVDFVAAVGHCSDQNARWKSMMEDTKVYQDHFGNDKRKAFLALYDGYSGKYASAVAANELHYLLLTEMAKFDPKIQCQCTFNMLEENDIGQYDLIRPPSISLGNKRLLHRDSVNMIHQIVYTCEEPEQTHAHLSSHHPIYSKLSEEDTDGSKTNSAHSTKDEYCRRLKAAFRQAYKLTDRVLAHGGDEKSRVRWSGTSALTIVLEQLEAPELTGSREPSDVVAKEDDVKSNGTESKDFEPPRTLGRLHIANAGNCQAVLVRDNRPYLLTKAHNYSNSKERNRITSSGGVFSSSEKEMRVNGVSLTTRGLGNHGDPTIKQLISWEPHTTTVPIDQYAQLLILATNGIWQVFSPQEAAELLLQVLPQNRIPTPGYISPSVKMLNRESPVPPESQMQNAETTSQPPVTAMDDEFAEVAIHLPLDDTAIHEPNSRLSVGAQNTARKSKERSSSVTFREDVKSVDGNTPADGQMKGSSTERKLLRGADSLLEADEDGNADMRSMDSGNEADVDTDWASTLAPDDALLRSALSNTTNPHRQLAKLLSERLVQSALLAGAKDNVSAVVVVLPGTRIVDVVES